MDLTWQQLPILVNCVLAFVSFTTFRWLSGQVERPLKTAFQGAVPMALIYFCAYIWLLFYPERAGEWSTTLRWIGPISWGLVWVYLPLASWKYLAQRAKKLEREAGRIVDRHGVE